MRGLRRLRGSEGRGSAWRALTYVIVASAGLCAGWWRCELLQVPGSRRAWEPVPFVVEPGDDPVSRPVRTYISSECLDEPLVVVVTSGSRALAIDWRQLWRELDGLPMLVLVLEPRATDEWTSAAATADDRGRLQAVMELVRDARASAACVVVVPTPLEHVASHLQSRDGWSEVPCIVSVERVVGPASVWSMSGNAAGRGGTAAIHVRRGGDPGTSVSVPMQPVPAAWTDSVALARVVDAVARSRDEASTRIVLDGSVRHDLEHWRRFGEPAGCDDNVTAFYRVCGRRVEIACLASSRAGQVAIDVEARSSCGAEAMVSRTIVSIPSRCVTLHRESGIAAPAASNGGLMHIDQCDPVPWRIAFGHGGGGTDFEGVLDLPQRIANGDSARVKVRVRGEFSREFLGPLGVPTGSWVRDE